MATGGIEDRIQEGLMTDEEAVNLKAMFNEMGARPKARTKEELQHWLLDYAASLKCGPQTHTQSPAPQVITVSGRKPWLVKFSADHGNEGYDLWRHQLHSLIKEKHPEKDIFDAIRSLLHGKAGSIVVRLGTEASITDILEKMDSVFGEVGTEADLLAALYSARQGPAESVSDWGCRLETLFDAAKRQATIPDNPDEVLRSVFWAGLRQELKDVSAYHSDTIRTFDELRTALRRIEKQHMKPSTEKMKSAACKSAQERDKEKSKEDKPDKAGYERLETMIQQMSTKFSNEIKGQERKWLKRQLAGLTMDRELHLPIGFQGDNTQDSMGEEEVDWNLVVVEEVTVNRIQGR